MKDKLNKNLIRKFSFGGTYLLVGAAFMFGLSSEA
ncbi:MSCRAMM family adhesin SdrC [Staphylococcus caprae]|nr:MSCRAMM family adhesin SdrC [Staphylococcus caprae]